MNTKKTGREGETGIAGRSTGAAVRADTQRRVGEQAEQHGVAMVAEVKVVAMREKKTRQHKFIAGNKETQRTKNEMKNKEEGREE